MSLVERQIISFEVNLKRSHQFIFNTVQQQRDIQQRRDVFLLFFYYYYFFLFVVVWDVCIQQNSLQ